MLRYWDIPIGRVVRHGASIRKSEEGRAESDRNGGTHSGRGTGNLFAYARFLMRRRHWHLRPGGDRSESTDLASYAYWPATILGLQILFNFPHFIASYRLLYQSKEIVYRYKWASIYLPIVLGSYLLFSLVHPVVFREPVNDKCGTWLT